MADAPEPPRTNPEHQKINAGDHGFQRDWLAGLHSLHGPPGPHPPLALPTCPLSPFVEPQTTPFSVYLSRQDLAGLLTGCTLGMPACAWQDIGNADEISEPGEIEEVPERKWAIYAVEEDGSLKVQMHRSWTGIKLVELTIDTSPPQLLPGDVVSLGSGGARSPSSSGDRVVADRGPRITHITFETHEDYKLKGADEDLYKYVAWEVCWWVLGVRLGPETES